MVIDPPLGHLLQRHLRRPLRRLRIDHCTRAHRHPRRSIQQQIDRRRVRKLGLRPKSPRPRVKLLQRRLHQLAHQLWPGISTPPRKRLVVLDSLHHAPRRLIYLIPPLFKSLRHRQQNPLQSRSPMPVIRGEIRAPKEWPPIRRQERRKRPSTLPADRSHRSLVPRIYIRPLVPVHLHRDKMLIDDPRNITVFIALPVHHMTPVAPHRAYVQQHRFVFLLRQLESLFAPLHPAHRLMHCRAQIRRRRTLQ